MVADEVDQRHRTGDEIEITGRNGRPGSDHAVNDEWMKRELIAQNDAVNAVLVEIRFLHELLRSRRVQMVVPTELPKIGREKKTQTGHSFRLPIKITPVEVDPGDWNVDMDHSNEEVLL